MNRIDRKTYYASIAKENDKTGATAMTRDEIVKIAWDCGILMRSHQHQNEPTKLERFAALVAAREREACAKVCEEIPLPEEVTSLTHLPTIERCAAAIRARGQEQPR